MQRVTRVLRAALETVSFKASSRRDATAQIEITRAVERFTVAFGTENIEGINDYYSDDLLKFRAGVKPEGKGDVITRLKATFPVYNCHVDVTNDEIVVQGGLAFARGTY